MKKCTEIFGCHHHCIIAVRKLEWWYIKLQNILTELLAEIIQSIGEVKLKILILSLPPLGELIDFIGLLGLR